MANLQLDQGYLLLYHALVGAMISAGVQDVQQPVMEYGQGYAIISGQGVVGNDIFQLHFSAMGDRVLMRTARHVGAAADSVAFRNFERPTKGDMYVMGLTASNYIDKQDPKKPQLKDCEQLISTLNTNIFKYYNMEATGCEMPKEAQSVSDKRWRKRDITAVAVVVGVMVVVGVVLTRRR